MTMHFSNAPRSRLSSAICSIWAASIGAPAADARAAPTPPTRPDTEAAGFLLAAAAEDFKASGAARPVAIRKARVGYFQEAGAGQYRAPPGTRRPERGPRHSTVAHR